MPNIGRDDLFIGLDIAVAVGNPAIISTALILTPISVFIAFLLHGNKVLPLRRPCERQSWLP